jgi:hypothetical protein
MARAIRLGKRLADSWVAGLAGKFIGSSFFDRNLLIGGEDTDVFKPDGALLLAFRHQALAPGVCQLAYPALRRAATPTDNRGTAAGGGWHRRVKADGTISNRRRARPVLSGVMGYADPQGQERYCRTTAYTAKQTAAWAKVQPLFRAANQVFKYAVPDRYAAQWAMAQETHPYWLIPTTAFTTATVNLNFQTAVHQDAGDLSQGFGVMCVLSAGHYAGGFLVFPKYRVAVDVRDRDVLLADVHEWHGNTPIVRTEEGYERISVVLYYRRNMVHCGSPTEEYMRAKHR